MEGFKFSSRTRPRFLFYSWLNFNSQNRSPMALHSLFCASCSLQALFLSLLPSPFNRHKSNSCAFLPIPPFIFVHHCSLTFQSLGNPHLRLLYNKKPHRVQFTLSLVPKSIRRVSGQSHPTVRSGCPVLSEAGGDMTSIPSHPINWGLASLLLHCRCLDTYVVRYYV
jgi:hypothetical protein